MCVCVWLRTLYILELENRYCHHLFSVLKSILLRVERVHLWDAIGVPEYVTSTYTRKAVQSFSRRRQRIIVHSTLYDPCLYFINTMTDYKFLNAVVLFIYGNRLNCTIHGPKRYSLPHTHAEFGMCVGGPYYNILLSSANVEEER